ncbi:MAG: DUF1579 family protein [candidate division Zixibacteria bacterium]|nr:DUF1579 family protein [candidate division Zixibacteria bacterium]
MKHLFLTIILLVLIVPVFAVDSTKTEESMPPMGPPVELKELKYLIGAWDVDMKMRQDPSQPWQDMKSSGSYDYILNGAAIRQNYKGEMMGMPFVGESTMCYNRELKKWQVTWLDNMFAQLSIYEGNMVDGKFVVQGEELYMGKAYLSRMTISSLTEKSFDWLMEMSIDGGKTWFSTMKAVYTKK